MVKKPKIIRIPEKRPERCCECPLLGTIPEHLVKGGSRFTLRCFLPGYEKEISKRGAHAEDKKHLFRCRPDEYARVLARKSGEIEVSEQDFYQYGLDNSAWLYERDLRKVHNS